VEPERGSDVQHFVRTPNWTTIALIGGLVLLLLLIAYFATGGNPDQDKLTGNELAQGEPQKATTPEKLCSSTQTYDLIKRDLFRRAAQLRGSDQAAFDQLSNYAALRMEHPVMESRDDSTGAVNCSGSLSLDLPPGVAIVGSRRTLTSDVDYTVQPAADGSGTVVLLRNVDAIVTPLATLAKVSQPERSRATGKRAQRTCRRMSPGPNRRTRRSGRRRVIQAARASIVRTPRARAKLRFAPTVACRLST
jgi:hypothetical protein